MEPITGVPNPTGDGPLGPATALVQNKERNAVFSRFLDDIELKRWYQNVSSELIIMADVCLRRLGELRQMQQKSGNSTSIVHSI